VKTTRVKMLRRHYRELLQKPERLYLVLALFFGFLFVVITPPLTNADEVNHFMRAYQLSSGHVLAPMVKGYAGGNIPMIISHS
jgi:hypothetical protein